MALNFFVEGFESTLNFLVCLPLKFRGYRARWSMVFFCELIRGERFTVINLSSYIWKPHIFQCWEFSISCTQSWRSCNYQPMTCMHSCHHLVLRILLIVYFLIAPSLQIICKWVDFKMILLNINHCLPIMVPFECHDLPILYRKGVLTGTVVPAQEKVVLDRLSKMVDNIIK